MVIYNMFCCVDFTCIIFFCPLLWTYSSPYQCSCCFVLHCIVLSYLILSCFTAHYKHIWKICIVLYCFVLCRYVLHYIVLICSIVLYFKVSWHTLYSGDNTNPSKMLVMFCFVLSCFVLSLIKLNFHIVYYTFCQSAQMKTWNVLCCPVLKCFVLCCPVLLCFVLFCFTKDFLPSPHLCRLALIFTV